MFKGTVAALGICAFSIGAQAESLIKPGVTEFSVTLNGETCKISRNQTKGNVIHKLYQTTERGRPQPISLAPGIETLGELEFIEYMQKAQTDPSILIVDTRTEGWHRNLRIPCTINVPYTQLNDDRFVALSTVIDEFGVEEKEDESLDFSKAKTIVGYCN
ncbi:MAG: sulfurtransferase, partial [Sneathiella sp.]